MSRGHGVVLTSHLTPAILDCDPRHDDARAVRRVWNPMSDEAKVDTEVVEEDENLTHIAVSLWTATSWPN